MDYQNTINLFNQPPVVNLSEATFEGSDYDPTKDDIRLRKQIADIYTLMKDNAWRTLKEIEQSFNSRYPQASISANLRHLKKVRYGSHTVERRPRGEREGGLWEYRMIVNEKVKIVIQ